MMTVEIMVAVNSVLLAICGYFLNAYLKSTREHDTDVDKKLDSLMIHRETCIRQFCDAEKNTADHKRLWGRVDEQRMDIRDHETRINALEKKVGQ